ncbi:Flavoprotein-like superfamily [Fusarium oxysporum f. sp. vasinfectum]|nr:Flavoprotein-like superfamily [Fusarium oxysporum f. sp. vasinfectum]
MAPKIAIVYYSMYGHIKQLAEAEKAGIEKAGGSADIFQVPETLPRMSSPRCTLLPSPPMFLPSTTPPSLRATMPSSLVSPPVTETSPAQWKAFWDKTGKQWASGGFWGKMAGIFVSTASQGGGQETTAQNAISTLTHHGIIYVPFGYAKAFGVLTDLSEVRGGSAWGAGTFAGADGSRQPSAKELELAQIQGENFYQTVANSQAKAAPEVASNTNKPAEAEKDTTAPKQENKGPQELKEVKEGPCGLPAKCVVQ